MEKNGKAATFLLKGCDNDSCIDKTNHFNNVKFTVFLNGQICVFFRKTVDAKWKGGRIFALVFGVWCNGNTGDSDSLVRGSNPCTPTKVRL